MKEKLEAVKQFALDVLGDVGHMASTYKVAFIAYSVVVLVLGFGVAKLA